MSNETQARLHFNLVINRTDKLARHMHGCGLCSPIQACDMHKYLVSELEAARKVYVDTLDRWSANKLAVGDVSHCANHCQE